MATDKLTTGWSRRQWLAAVGLVSVSAGAWPAPRGASSATRWAAAWQLDDGRHQVGWLALSPGARHHPSAFRVASAIDVPNRAHGLWVDAEGRLLAVARRPGDWLLRWAPGQAPAWHWMPPDRSLNGHVLTSPDGRWLLSTETDLDSGAGLLGVRDARTLALHSEWPTLGRDPHQLVWDRLQPGCVMVANGGISTRPETGRAKIDLAHMDSSLVRLAVHSGQVQGQWRLHDARLSLRHLAWNASHLGIALQAEHEDPAQRQAAPVLALFDGQTVRTQTGAHALAGYGGDVAAFGPGFAVGCPRAGGVAWFDAHAHLCGFVPFAHACALASDARGGCWVAGHPMAAHCSAGSDSQTPLATCGLPYGMRLDNHWLAWPALPGGTESLELVRKRSGSAWRTL